MTQIVGGGFVDSIPHVGSLPVGNIASESLVHEPNEAA